jgi:hypothetical protein
MMEGNIRGKEKIRTLLTAEEFKALFDQPG